MKNYHYVGLFMSGSLVFFAMSVQTAQPFF